MTTLTSLTLCPLNAPFLPLKKKIMLIVEEVFLSYCILYVFLEKKRIDLIDPLTITHIFFMECIHLVAVCDAEKINQYHL